MFEANVYIERRKKLRESISSGILLIPANTESPMNYPGNCFHFRQDSSFLYYFGLDTADIFGCIDIESGEEILFADEITIEDIVWMGYQPTFADQAQEVGIRKVLSVDKLQDYLHKAVSQGRVVHYLPPYQGQMIIRLSELLGKSPAQIGSSYSVELVKAVIAMRSLKEDREIAEIEKACKAGYEMHISAFRNCRPGKSEQELYGIMEGIAYQQGAGTSFSTILSQNGETLHNYNHFQTLTEGRLLLVDAGAEALSHYCSDHTRTIPVSGKFTPFQADIYNLVVAAQAKGIELSAPEVTNQSIHLAVCKVLAEGLKDAGIMKGNIDNAVAAGAPAMFLPCGLGHHMGLDVHDMEGLGEDYVGYNEVIKRIPLFGYNRLRMGKELKPGMVMTVEPGVYFIPSLIAKWEAEGINKEFINFEAARKKIGFGGIRLEDDILITPDGNRILGEKRLPTTIEEVLAAMNGK